MREYIVGSVRDSCDLATLTYTRRLERCGFIAEEVAEIDPRLVFWGQDEDGEPRMEGVNYDQVRVASGWVPGCFGFSIRC